MSIRFRCPFCKKPLKLVNAAKQGQPLQCPNPICKKWIVFNDNGLPQEGGGSAVPPPNGARSQSPGDWLRVDGVDDEDQLNKIKRAPIPQASPPSRPRAPSYERGRAEENVFETESINQPDFPPALPGRFRDEVGEDDDAPPIPPQRGVIRQAPTLLPPPPRGTTRRAAPKSGGSNRLLIIAILAIGLIGVGVAGYFVFTRETEPEFVKKSYGVIEISTKGVKAIVVTPFPSEGSYDYVLEKEFEPLNINAGNLEEDGKAFDPRSLDHAKNAVRNFFKLLQEDYNLPPERIAIVRSSGVVAGFKDKVTLEKNKKLLEEEIKEITGLTLNAFTPEDEAGHIARFVIPQRERNEAMLIDIGSGNIKGGYFNVDNLFYSTDADTGTSRFAKEVEKAVKGGKDPQIAAKDLSRTLVSDKLKRDIDNNPGLTNRNKIYFCGGLTWVMRTFTHPNDPVKNLLVELTPDDLAKFRKLVLETPPEKWNETILAEVQDEKQRASIEADLIKIQGIFKPDAIRAGAEILSAFFEVYQIPKKKLFFYSKGVLAPNMGFVLKQLGLSK